MSNNISENLLNKSKAFFDRAKDLGIDDPLHPLLIAFSLEFMIRSGLAYVDPILTIDFQRNEQNLTNFFREGIGKDKIKTASITQAVSRLTYFVSKFTQAEADTVNAIFEARNIEVHSSELGFIKYPPHSWLINFYRVVFILLDFMEKPGDDFFGQDFEDISAEITKQDTLTKTDVFNLVETHKKRFNLSAVVATAPLTWRENEITKTCPSCSNLGILSGKNISKSKAKICEEEILETFDYLPTSFKCEYCGLEIKGSQEIKHIDNLNAIFKKNISYDPVDYLNIDIDERIREKYEDFEPSHYEYMDE